MTVNTISISDLLTQGGLELLAYYSYVVLIILMANFAQKFPKLKLIILLITTIFAFIYQFNLSSTLEVAKSVCFSLALTGELYLFRILNLGDSDYLFIFLSLLFPERMFSSALSILGNSIVFAILLFVLPLLIKLNHQKIRENFLNIVFIYIYLAISAYILTIANELNMYFSFPNKVSRYISLLIELSIASLLLLGTYYLNKKFHAYLIKLKYANLHYLELSRWAYLVVLSTTLIFFILNFTSVLITQNVDNILTKAIPVFCLFILILELVFICLLIYLFSYRYQLFQTQLAIKNQEVSSQNNLKDLLKVRHDIKNIFYTMGSYVNQSDDKNLKEYFNQEIYPFAQKEIINSKTIQELYKIPLLPLQSLLQVKICQALDKNINIAVKISLENFFLGIDLIDLSRMLGIFLDNAIEAEELLLNNEIKFSIKQQAGTISYIIKNKVSPNFSVTNLQKRCSSKGENRGLGLKIIDDITKRYDNVDINTYLSNNYLIQIINIEN